MNADTNTEQAEFLDSISKSEIQTLKFLDYYDLKDFFVLTYSCVTLKKEEIKNLHQELYLTAEKEFKDIFSNLL